MSTNKLRFNGDIRALSAEQNKFYPQRRKWETGSISLETKLHNQL